MLAAALLAASTGRGEVATVGGVVSLSSEASEVLVGIGAAGALVAVDEGSHRVDGLASLPTATLATVRKHSPTLVVAPRLDAEDARRADRLRAEGIDVIEFAPHDFDDAFALCRTLGVRLGHSDRARAFIRDHSRALALISNSSLGQRRPRVAGVLELDPLVVAGGHSFVTDLIEIAGAESVTHGTADLRIPMSAAELLALGPELVWVVRPDEVPQSERDALRATLSGVPRFAFVVLDARGVWLRDAAGVARRLRAQVTGRLGP